MILIVFFSLFIYLETIYHLFSFGFAAMSPILSIGLCAIIAGLEAIILSFLRDKAKRIGFWVLMSLDILVYIVQLVYLKIFKQPLLMSLAIHGAGDAVTNYWKEALSAVLAAIIPIMFMLLPIAVVAVLLKQEILVIEKKRTRLRSHKVKKIQRQREILRSLIICVGGILLFGLGMLAGKFNFLISTEMYKDFVDPQAVFEEYGVLASVRRDIHGTIFGNKSADAFQSLGSGSEDKEEAAKTDKSPNVMDIDFDKLIANEKRDEVKALHQYVKGRTPTRKNKYTGMFEGYNLIYMTAEGFAPYCVSEELTPTLYKMLNSGFQFKNYYVPLWHTSTSDGEFANCTGLLPDDQFSFKRSGSNAMPFLLPGFFKGEGVQSHGYHNNSLSYYDRYKTHENMGYFFKAGTLGKLSEAEWGDHIFQMEHPKAWPQSDLEMMQGTLKEYIDEPQFHAYYMTVSGHLQYTFQGNAMSGKNKDLVKDLPYSEKAKAYIACNIEFDRALGYLIEELEKAGKLDKTVICFGADHYPYGLEEAEIEELRGEPLKNKRDIYHNGLVLWNSAMEPVVVEKPCSAVDIVPTLLNLFGFEYDSRLYSGRDILSSSKPLVVFADRSFLTDQVYYDARERKAESMNGQPVKDAYVQRTKKQVKDLFTFSAGILDYDYYKTLEKYYPAYNVKNKE